MPYPPPPSPSPALALSTQLILPERSGGYSKGQETREAILHAALMILIEEGYRAMSMRRVAAACGMKFGNLTYHYRTREDLVRELLESVIRAYEQEFVALAHQSGLNPAQRLERYCRLLMEDITTKKTTRLFPELWALANHDGFVEERVQELYARARQPLQDILEAMRPDLAAADIEVLALFISCSMEGTTIFAGHNKPHIAQMPAMIALAVEGFTSMVAHYRPTPA